MITGDNPLTACHVAKELRFTKKKLLVLTEPNDGTWERKKKSLKLFDFRDLESTEWKWESVNRDINLPIQPANIRDLTKDYALCVTGEVKWFVYITWIWNLFFQGFGTFE